VTLLALVAQAAAETNIVNDEFLERLRATVRAEHPSVAAAEARFRGADASVRAVRLWEDPMVGAGFMAAETEMRRDDGDMIFSAEQVLPRRKLYEAEKAKMRAEKSMAAAEFQTVALKLETLAAQTAIELALADEIVAIDASQVNWLQQMVTNARERLKDPSGTAAESLRMESELAMAEQKHQSHLLMRRRLARQLNILLGQAADQSWEKLKLPDSGAATPDLDDELAKIAAANPSLQGLARAMEAARSEIEVARRESKPVFSVGVDTRIYSGGDFRESTIGAKMSIPLLNRASYRARVERARDRHEAAEKELAAMERELRSMLVMAYTDAEDAARQAATFSKEVIPRAEQAAESLQNAWISSKATLLETLDARRSALTSRLEERRFVAAHRAALETLRSIVPPKVNP
jgi:outer membrane protein, heavy metal efflux system